MNVISDVICGCGKTSFLTYISIYEIEISIILNRYILVNVEILRIPHFLIWEKASNNDSETFNLSEMDDDVLQALIQKDIDNDGKNEGYKID